MTSIPFFSRTQTTKVYENMMIWTGNDQITSNSSKVRNLGHQVYMHVKAMENSKATPGNVEAVQESEAFLKSELLQRYALKITVVT